MAAGNRRIVLCSAALILSTAGCERKLAQESLALVGVTGCTGTEAGRACLTLTFSANDSVRASSKQPLRGDLHWGLFTGGEVGLLGPGSSIPMRYGTTTGVDLSEAGSTQSVTVPNVPAGSYQALGYLDLSGTNPVMAGAGDPVTFPSDPFPAPGDQVTSVAVVFDLIR